MLHSPRHVAEVLRDAVDGIAHDRDISPNHPDLLELKRIVDQKLATLEAEAPGAVLDQSRSDKG